MIFLRINLNECNVRGFHATLADSPSWRNLGSLFGVVLALYLPHSVAWDVGNGSVDEEVALWTLGNVVNVLLYVAVTAMMLHSAATVGKVSVMIRNVEIS